MIGRIICKLGLYNKKLIKHWPGTRSNVVEIFKNPMILVEFFSNQKLNFFNTERLS